MTRRRPREAIRVRGGARRRQLDPVRRRDAQAAHRTSTAPRWFGASTQAALQSKASESIVVTGLPAGARGRRGQGPRHPPRLQPALPAGAVDVGQDRPVGGLRSLVGGPLHSLRSAAPRHRDHRSAGRCLSTRARLDAGAGLPRASRRAGAVRSQVLRRAGRDHRATRAAARSCFVIRPRSSRSSSRTRRRSSTSTPSKSSKRSWAPAPCASGAGLGAPSMPGPFLLPLRGAIKSYAWGSRRFLARLEGRADAIAEPGSGALDGSASLGTFAGSLERRVDLAARCDRERSRRLPRRARSVARFGVELPFLLKILAIERAALAPGRTPIAIAAAAGFARERDGGGRDRGGQLPRRGATSRS